MERSLGPGLQAQEPNCRFVTVKRSAKLHFTNEGPCPFLFVLCLDRRCPNFPNKL